MFSCCNASDYRRWLDAFSVERKVVTEDKRNGFHVTLLTQRNLQLQQSNRGKLFQTFRIFFVCSFAFIYSFTY